MSKLKFHSAVSIPISSTEQPVSVNNFTDWIAGLDNLRQMNMTVWEYMQAFQHFIGNDTELEGGIEGIINKIEDFASKKQQDLCYGRRGQGCRESHLYKILSGYMYPVMLLLCLLGNSLNISVYSFDFMRKSVTVKILAARALTNSLFVLFLSFEAMKTLQIWDPHIYMEWERMYWHAWPYLVMITNTFGSCAMWITVLMTLERYLYVVYPMRSKLWCTNRNFYRAVLGILAMCMGLQSFFPVTRFIDIRNCTESDRNSDKLIYLVKLRPEPLYIMLEYFYHYLNLILAILIPMTLMVFMSLVVAWRLLYQHVSLSHYTAQKRCITRITLSTTAAHLILELPTLVVFMAGALHGSGLADRNQSICICKIVSNFLGTCNASILFFIYLGFSDHFRRLLLIRLKMRDSEIDPLILQNRAEASDAGKNSLVLASKRYSNAPTQREESVALIPPSRECVGINKSGHSKLSFQQEVDVVSTGNARINGTVQSELQLPESSL